MCARDVLIQVRCPGEAGVGFKFHPGGGGGGGGSGRAGHEEHVDFRHR